MDDYAAKATEKAIGALEKRINAVYSQAQKDIEAKTKDFWERHKAKDAMYQQQLKDGKISKADYDAWLRGQVFQGKQWEAKLQQVQATLTQANKDALEIANGGRIQVFATNANWQSYQIEKSAGVNFGFGIYDSHTVTRLLRDDPDLLPPRKLSTSKDKAWNKGNINRQISQGIIQGGGIDKIAQRLANVTGTNRKAMLTNARTMMTNAQNAGRQESYQRAVKMGIRMKKVWMATLDGHTRTNHRKLDGQSVDVDEPFKIGGYSIMYPGDRRAKPGMVHNCRCTMVSELVDYPTPDGAQRYDNVSGKPIKNLTYNEWERSKTASSVNTVTIGVQLKKMKYEDQIKWIMSELSVDSKKADAYRYSIESFTYKGNENMRKYQFGTYKPTGIPSVDDMIKEHVENVEEYIRNAPKWEGETFRGLGLSKDDLESVLNSGTIQNGALTSWSSSIKVAEEYARENGRIPGRVKVILHCTDQKMGTPIKHLSHYTREDEVLCSSKSEYKILRHEEIGDVTHIYLKEVTK